MPRKQPKHWGYLSPPCTEDPSTYGIATKKSKQRCVVHVKKTWMEPKTMRRKSAGKKSMRQRNLSCHHGSQNRKHDKDRCAYARSFVCSEEKLCAKPSPSIVCWDTYLCKESPLLNKNFHRFVAEASLLLTPYTCVVAWQHTMPTTPTKVVSYVLRHLSIGATGCSRLGGGKSLVPSFPRPSFACAWYPHAGGGR